MSYLTPEELLAAGFRHIGRDVKVSRKASIYGASRIALGDNVRIDDFCVLSAGDGGIEIGRNVHIACFTALIGQATIRIGDFAGLSSRVNVYSSTDDYSGSAMTNPTVPASFTNVQSIPVEIGKHCIIGAGTVILPGVRLGEGAAIGALTLVTRDVPAWTIVMGNPLRSLGPRSQQLLNAEQALLAGEHGGC